MFNFLLCAEEAAKKDYSTIIMIVVLVAVFVVMMIISNINAKKRQKAEQERMSKLAPGDKVLTASGIIGTIVKIVEISPVDMNVIIETGDGDSKCTLTFDVRGIYQVLESAVKEEEIVDTFETEEVVSETEEATETSTEPTEEKTEETAAEPTEEKAE